MRRLPVALTLLTAPLAAEAQRVARVPLFGAIEDTPGSLLWRDAQMITRRSFLIGPGVGSLSTALPAFAQQGGTSPKIGVLWHAGSAEEEKIPLGGLVEGFGNLGYVDGKNIVLEHRFPNEQPERFFSLAAELVQSRLTC